MATPLFLNTGGGLIGAIRAWVIEHKVLFDFFGDRVAPGRQEPKTAYPYVVVTHVSGMVDDVFTDVARGGIPGDRFDVWKESIQVSTYADNYEATRLLGRLLHVHISRQTFCADLIPVTLYPDSRMMVMDPRQAERSADIWHADYRYHYWTADKLLPEENTTTQ